MELVAPTMLKHAGPVVAAGHDARAAAAHCRHRGHQRECVRNREQVAQGLTHGTAAHSRVLMMNI